jgi:uncharacterized protein (TIGR00290 family)
MAKQAVFCWSGGKDSALALYKILQQDEYEIKALLTTVNGEYKRVSMHGVREELIEEQARSVGFQLHKVYVTGTSNEEYECRMGEYLTRQKNNGINYVIYGDIFLEDLRIYRDAKLEKLNMQGVYPLWKKHTKELAIEFIEYGFKTIVCCVNDAFLTKKDVGFLFDKEFLLRLPKNIDPCGENGEFHTFCFDGPLFNNPIHVEAGEKVYRPLILKSQSETTTKGFWFCELCHPRMHIK